jgi:RNA polymerase sigma-70 factor (ECF subfamily)
MSAGERNGSTTPLTSLPPGTDAGALTEAYRAYRAPLVRYAHRFTGDTAAAHDVVQDVFVKLWEIRETLTVTSSFRALLYTMTRNRALNRTRAHARLAPREAVEDVRDPAPGGAPDAGLQADELSGHLRRWIAALPPRRAEAFVLSRFDALSHAEIADVMGLSVRTVDTHIVHALRDLRARLDALYRDPVRIPSEP